MSAVVSKTMERGRCFFFLICSFSFSQFSLGPDHVGSLHTMGHFSISNEETGQWNRHRAQHQIPCSASHAAPWPGNTLHSYFSLEFELQRLSRVLWSVCRAMEVPLNQYFRIQNQPCGWLRLAQGSLRGWHWLCFPTKKLFYIPSWRKKEKSLENSEKNKKQKGY